MLSCCLQKSSVYAIASQSQAGDENLFAKNVTAMGAVEAEKNRAAEWEKYECMSSSDEDDEEEEVNEDERFTLAIHDFVQSAEEVTRKLKDAIMRGSHRGIIRSNKARRTYLLKLQD